MPDRQQVNRNTESVDNYLKAILSLSGAQESRVSSTALAERLDVAPASITNMLQKLANDERPLVDYERHRGVRLSAAGKRRALEIVRHHRLIETFLYKVLDYPIEELHDEAERLEHFISERFEERIAAKLGYPLVDPHGHLIPALDGYMPDQLSVPLTEILASGSFVFESVNDRDATLVKLVEDLGLVPGTRIRVNAHGAPASYSVTIGEAGEPVELSGAVAAEIRIVPCDEC